jgi:hypothetical protein
VWTGETTTFGEVPVTLDARQTLLLRIKGI